MSKIRFPLRFLATVVFLWAGCRLASAAESPFLTASELVEQLGDDQYATRTQAEQTLTDLGIAARDELLAGLQHSDLEIRRSCQRILTPVLEEDYQQRLKAFAQDPDGKLQIELPAWQRYRTIVGADAEARKLFVEMQKAEAGLLESLENGSYDAINLRTVEIWQLAYGQYVQLSGKREMPSRATLAALLLASSDPRLDTTEASQIWANFTSLLFQGDFAKSLKEGPYKQSTRALLGAWARTPSTQAMNSQKLRMVVIHDIKEVGLELARDGLDQARQRQPNETAMAIEAIARLGGKPYAALLTDSLKDDRMCSLRVLKGNVRQEIQIRDVALAWLIHLTGQDPADYGLKQAKSWFDTLKRHSTSAFNFANFCFESDEQRDKALAKWNQWLEKHSLDEPPEIPQHESDPDTADTPPEEQEKDPATAPPDEPHSTLPAVRLAERHQVYQLTRARQFVEDGLFAEAVTLLGDIIADENDYFYRPNLDVSLYRQLKTQAEQILASFPAAGRNAYELHYGAIAKQLLSDALDNYDMQAVAAIERKYFFTEAGAEAAFLLGTHHRALGRNVQAALYFQRLRSLSAIADRYEPSLSLQLAICWHQAGMSSRARESLQSLRAAADDRELEVAGQSQPLFSSGQDPLKWLEQVVGAAPLGPFGWAVFRGDTSGTMTSDAGTPYLRGQLQSKLSDSDAVTKSVKEIHEAFQKDRRTVLPTLTPLVVGNTVIVRTPLAIRASDLNTGTLLWESPAQNALWQLLRYGDAKQQKDQLPFLREGLERRLWEDPCFGTLTSNGRLVFVIEDLGFRLGPDFRNPVVQPDGRRTLDVAALRGANRLAAIDVRTGKLVWQAGDSVGSSPEAISDGRFLGPPLPLGDQLFAVVEFPEQTLLLALDGSNGEVLRRWVLDAPWDEEAPTAKTPQTAIIEPEPTRGVNPVFADGVIVCRSSKNRYVAVDLTSRSLRWAYAPPEREVPNGMRVVNAAQRKMLSQQQRDRSDQWSDAGAIIADEHVVLTPWGSDELYCLNLDNGTLAWTAPREDGLYVAGVDQGKVVVVGRGSVRVLDLADGSAIFDTPTLLPLGATPSGRGYVSPGRVYIPLTTAEVVAIDLQTGNIASRSLSPDSIVPGNLARVDEGIVSWGPNGLWRFSTVQSRVEELASQDKSPAEDMDAFLELTELILYEGRVDEAIQRLQLARAHRPTPEAARLLGEALLQLDGPQWAEWKDTAAEIALTIENPQLKAKFLERLAIAYQQAGQTEAALEAYLQILDSIGDDDPMVFVTPALTARRSRFLQASLRTLLDQLPLDRRESFESRLADRLDTATSMSTLHTLAFHPKADSLRLRLADELNRAKTRLQSELLLRHVWHHGNESQQAVAAGKLAELLRSADRSLEAARFYALLDGDLADIDCGDGKTGSQLVKALPAEDPVRAWLDGRELWPMAPTVEESKPTGKDASQIWQYSPLSVSGDGSPLCPLTTVDMDIRNRKLVGSDGQGGHRWEIDMKPEGKNHHIWFNNYAMNEARQTGHLTIAWLGTRIMAIDQLAEKPRVLWHVDTLEADANQMWMIPQLQLQLRMQIQIQGGRVSQLPQSFVATPNYVAFQKDRILTAVDPISGETIWLRDDLPAGCDLFGSDEYLIATPADSSQARILSAIDGHQIGQCKTPERDDRLTTYGHHVLTWIVGNERSDLLLIDPRNGDTLWKRQFSSKAQAAAIHGAEVGILEPDGKFVVLNLRDGSEVIRTEVDEEPELDNIVVLKSDRRCILIANRPKPKQEGPTSWNRALPGHQLVEGKVYALDVTDGKKMWSAEVTEQAIKVNYPPLAPMLTFFHRHQKAIKMANNAWRSDRPQVRIKCLDARTGEELHESSTENSYDQGYGLEVDTAKRTIEIKSRMKQIRFEYSS